MLAIIVFGYDYFAFQAYQRSIVDQTMHVFGDVQESYNKEFKTFNLNFIEMKKYLQLTDEVQGFANIDDVPLMYRDKIPSDEYPFLRKGRFKIIILIQSKKYNKVSIWSFMDYGNKREIYSGKMN